MAALPKRVLVVVVVVVAVTTILAAPGSALAIDHLVGGSKGWSLKFHYDDWVAGNDFIVGDTLVFNYTKGQHTVVQAATAASFAACSQANNLGVWNSGEDRITLSKSGNWWFFCGIHCEQGMKFNITVLPVVKLSSSSLPARAQGGGVAVGIAGVVAVVALLF